LLYVVEQAVQVTVTSDPALHNLSPDGGFGIAIATDALAVTLGMNVAENAVTERLYERPRVPTKVVNVCGINAWISACRFVDRS
jgi:hypothetical protein